MKNLTRFLIALMVITVISFKFDILIKLYEEKTTLEIQKLKYELSIYKENEESLKQALQRSRPRVNMIPLKQITERK